MKSAISSTSSALALRSSSRLALLLLFLHLLLFLLLSFPPWSDVLLLLHVRARMTKPGPREGSRAACLLGERDAEVLALSPADGAVGDGQRQRGGPTGAGANIGVATVDVHRAAACEGDCLAPLHFCIGLGRLAVDKREHRLESFCGGGLGRGRNGDLDGYGLHDLLGRGLANCCCHFEAPCWKWFSDHLGRYLQFTSPRVLSATHRVNSFRRRRRVERSDRGEAKTPEIPEIPEPTSDRRSRTRRASRARAREEPTSLNDRSPRRRKVHFLDFAEIRDFWIW